MLNHAKFIYARVYRQHRNETDKQPVCIRGGDKLEINFITNKLFFLFRIWKF